MRNNNIVSLCVSLGIQKNNDIGLLFRIADINENNKLVPYVIDDSQQKGGENTNTIYHPKDQIPSEGTMGFWEWYSPDGKRQLSNPYTEYKWIEYLQLSHVSSLEELQNSLHSGIKIVGAIDHDYLIAFSNNGETIQCVHCKSKDFHILNGKMVLNDNVYKLDIYEISNNDIGEIMPQYSKNKIKPKLLQNHKTC